MGELYRAKILNVNNEEKKVSIQYFDADHKEEKSFNDVFQFSEELQQLEIKSVRIGKSTFSPILEDNCPIFKIDPSYLEEAKTETKMDWDLIYFRFLNENTKEFSIDEYLRHMSNYDQHVKSICSQNMMYVPPRASDYV